ncbi:MAG: PAS domain S-box protein [Acidobacteria bacterium]|nr:PAS domain S-box protein [Acidobacteriota bacterium]
MSRFSLSLRVRLVALVVIGLLPPLGLLLYTSAQVRERDVLQAKTNALQLARIVEQRTAEAVDSARELLIALASNPLLREGDPVAHRDFLANLLRQQEGYLNFGTISADGRLLASAVPVPLPMDLSDLSYFQRAMASRKFARGDYRIGPALHAAYPLLDEKGDVRIVFFAALDLDRFSKVRSAAGLPAESSFLILDAAGTVLVRDPQFEKWVGKPMGDHPMVRTILSKKEGTAEQVDLDGIQRLVGFMPLAGDAGSPGGYVAVSIPRSAALAQANRTLALNLVLMGVVSIVALAAARLFADLFLLRRINALLEATKRMAAGDLTARTGEQAGGGEFGELAQAFDEMADALERREASLRESEHRFRTFMDNSPAVAFVKDQEGRYVYINRPFELHFKTSLDQLKGKTDAELFPAETVQQLRENDLKILASGRMTELVEIVPTANGVPRRWSVFKFPFREASGRPLLAGMAIDVTERQRAEDALRATSETLQEIVQTSPLAIVAIDTGGRVQAWNKSAERIFGWSESEVLGLPLPTIPEEQRGELLAQMKDEQGGMRRSALEVRRLRKDGSFIDVSLWTAPLCDSRGAVIGGLGILADMTERKQLEEQLRQAQKMEAIGQLAGGVAHDFNNLLTVINGYAHLLLARLPEGDAMRKSLDEIKKAGERAASLTRQLLAFSRKQVLEPKVLDLNVIVGDTDKMLRRLIGEDIELVSVLAPGLGRVKADPGQIEQVIMNLAVNARDAMPQGGQLTIETADVELDEAYARQHVAVRPGPYVLLAVSDNGCGMDGKILSHIFEPFFTTKEKGTGMGLATVYGIVKQSGGNIWVYSEPGQGTTFKIYLPRVEESVEVARPAEPPRGTPEGSEIVLLAEDEEPVRKLVRQTLEMNGYTVLEARHGPEALQICERHAGSIHLIVTDVIMPEMSGRELAYRLTQLRPGIKVLYLSGYTSDAIVHHGVLDQGVAFLQKPFTPDALARKVREVLDAPQKS